MQHETRDKQKTNLSLAACHLSLADMLKPLSDHVVIEPLKEEKKKSGIILPDTVEKEKSEKGKVIAVGPGKLGENGKRMSLEVKKGDIVLFTKYGPNEVKVEGKEYLIAREEDILAILN